MSETERMREMMQEDEISLYDLVQTVLEGWKLIAVMAFLGVLAGAAGWWMKGYDAELKAKTVASLDFVEWRRIVTGLPALAEKRAASASAESLALYRLLERSEWWSKNVVPQYRYTKNDLKDLGAVAKEDLDRGTTQIEAVLFRGKGKDGDDAAAVVVGAERFVREGGLLLALKSMVERRDLDARRVLAETEAKLARGEVELGYLRQRSRLLANLAQRYPEKQTASLQTVLDPKGDSARYLPLGTQQIAVESEINALEESLNRARDRMAETDVSRAFVGQALALLKSEPDGFALAERLLAIEAGIRKDIDPSNKAKLAAINEISSEVNGARERFLSLFEKDGLVSVQRPGRGMPLALGLLGGGLAGVLLVFFGSAWRRARRERAVSVA